MSNEPMPEYLLTKLREIAARPEITADTAAAVWAHLPALLAEVRRLSLPIVGLQAMEQQREEARSKALRWETDYLSEHERADKLLSEVQRLVADAATLSAALAQATLDRDEAMLILEGTDRQLAAVQARTVKLAALLAEFSDRDNWYVSPEREWCWRGRNQTGDDPITKIDAALAGAAVDGKETE